MVKVIAALAVFAVALVAAQEEVNCGPISVTEDSDPDDRTRNTFLAQNNHQSLSERCCSDRGLTIVRMENSSAVDVGAAGVTITRTPICGPAA